MPEHLTEPEAAGRLGEHATTLAGALTRWAARDDTRPDAEARQSANTAMDAIDAALAELHALRSALVGQIRASDDATAVRVDRLLAGREAR
jgi:hypothetical protein